MILKNSEFMFDFIDWWDMYPILELEKPSDIICEGFLVDLTDWSIPYIVLWVSIYPNEKYNDNEIINDECFSILLDTSLVEFKPRIGDSGQTKAIIPPGSAYKTFKTSDEIKKREDTGKYFLFQVWDKETSLIFEKATYKGKEYQKLQKFYVDMKTKRVDSLVMRLGFFKRLKIDTRYLLAKTTWNEQEKRHKLIVCD